MGRLSIVCWLWNNPNGRRRGVYKPCHVNALSRMLEKHMSIPYELICITDQDIKVDCRTFPLWEFSDINRNGIDGFRKLRIFDPLVNRSFGPRIMSIDLDVLIEDDLAPLISERSFQAVKGTKSPINSGLFTFKSGTNAHIWETFSESSLEEIEKTEYVGSDQAWMSIKAPLDGLWGTDEGVWTWRQVYDNGLPAHRRIVMFPGSLKPWGGDIPKYMWKGNWSAFEELSTRYLKYLC